MPRLVRDHVAATFCIATSALIGIALDAAAPTHAYGFAFTTVEQSCRDAVATATVKLAGVASKTLVGCHKSRDRGGSGVGTDCNDTAVADDGAIAKASASLTARSASRCGTLDPGAVRYQTCPAPCSAIGNIDDFTEVAACIDCLVRDGTELLSGSCQASPTPPLAGAELACHDDLGRAYYKHFRVSLKERRRCQRFAEAGGASDTATCATADQRGKIAQVEAIARDLIERSCDGADLAALGACSTASASALADCVLASSEQQAGAIFLAMYDLGGSVITTTTTTTLPPQDPLCPETVELILHGRTGVACSDNADCVAGVCDPGLGRCTTATDLDTGWTGVSHNSDISDAATVQARLRCPGPFDSQASEPCGECLVIGVDPAARACRCANDNRAICDEPFAADADDCGGATCNCYLGPPLSLSSGNTPVCVVNRLREDVRGTANVDAGSSESRIRLGSVVYLGEGLTQPCPYCTGDPVPGDGARGGTCMLGDDAGAMCDTDAVNRTFPAPGGDGHSLDCFPSSGKNVTGTGLKIAFDQTTGTADPISATIPCFFNSFVCHCMVCTGDSALACDSDAVCAAAGAGTCTTFAHGANPKTNGCTGDFICSDQGGGEGRCNQGPDSSYCDGVTTAEGNGFVSCNSNADCAASSCGSVSCGQCTIVERRPCFLNTIEATGTPSPGQPTTVGTFCIPPTSNAGVNAVAGLPGPGRLANAQSSTLYCASNPSVEYTPGSGGCP